MAELDNIEQMFTDEHGNLPEGAGEEPKGEEGGAVPEPKEDEPKPPEGGSKPDEGADSGKFNVSENFEGFENLDSVKTAVERSKLYTAEVEEELVSLRKGRTAVEDLEKQVKELKGRQPFKNPKFYQLDKLEESDPEKAKIYQKFMFGDNSDEDVVRFRMMLDHPKRFQENPGFLQRQLNQKYADYLGDEFTAEDTEYMDAKTQLGIDADAARKMFNDEIGKVEIPAIKSEEDVRAENEKFVKGWNEPFAEVKVSLAKIQVPVLDEKDPTKSVGYMDFDIPEAELKEVHNMAANHIFSQRLEPTKENMEQAKKVALGIYLVDNFAKINTAFANQLAKETGAKWRKTINNPQKPGADGLKPDDSKPSEENTEKAIVADILGR